MGVEQRYSIKISTKGQITLPKVILGQHRWFPGTRLTVEDTPEGVLLRAVPAFPETEIDAVFGSMKYAGSALSLEDMDAAVASAAFSATQS